MAGDRQDHLGLERREALDGAAQLDGALGRVGRAGERHREDREDAGDAGGRLQPRVVQRGEGGRVVAVCGELELPHADALGAGRGVRLDVLVERLVEGRDLGDRESGLGHGWLLPGG
jgi:hypothetical protein